MISKDYTPMHGYRTKQVIPDDVPPNDEWIFRELEKYETERAAEEVLSKMAEDEQVVRCNPNNSCVNCNLNGINIKITNKCNGNCAFCVEKNGYSPEEAPVEKLIEATNTLYTSKNILVLGGEPLLYPHLEEYLKGINTGDRKIYLTTNGTLLSDGMVDMLSNYLSGINISMHYYTEEKNREIFGIKNYSFFKIHQAINRFHEHNVPVRINCVIVKGGLDTPEKCSKMIDLAMFLGADHLRFMEVQNQPDMWVNSQALFPKTKLPDDPYVDGCEQEVCREGKFLATVKMGCGIVVPNRRRYERAKGDEHSERRVVYPNGEVKDGWYEIVDGKAEYFGKERPVKTEVEYKYINTNSYSCY